VVAEPGGMLSYILYVSLFGASERAKVCPSDGFGSDPGGVLESRRCGIIRQLAKSEIKGILMSLFGFLFRISPGREREKIVIFKMKNERNKQI
jgi:hypothetical protein